MQVSRSETLLFLERKVLSNINDNASFPSHCPLYKYYTKHSGPLHVTNTAKILYRAFAFDFSSISELPTGFLLILRTHVRSIRWHRARTDGRRRCLNLLQVLTPTLSERRYVPCACIIFAIYNKLVLSRSLCVIFSLGSCELLNFQTIPTTIVHSPHWKMFNFFNVGFVQEVNG